mgnify:CR=1 FL=1
MKRTVTIWHQAAEQAAYDENRNPRKDEGTRVLIIDAPPGILHLNGIVQEKMMGEGFQRNDWKILSHD